MCNNKCHNVTGWGGPRSTGVVSSLEAGERMGAAGESGGMFQAGEALCTGLEGVREDNKNWFWAGQRMVKSSLV